MSVTLIQTIEALRAQINTGDLVLTKESVIDALNSLRIFDPADPLNPAQAGTEGDEKAAFVASATMPPPPVKYPLQADDINRLEHDFADPHVDSEVPATEDQAYRLRFLRDQTKQLGRHILEQCPVGIERVSALLSLDMVFQCVGTAIASESP